MATYIRVDIGIQLWRVLSIAQTGKWWKIYRIERVVCDLEDLENLADIMICTLVLDDCGQHDVPVDKYLAECEIS